MSIGWTDFTICSCSTVTTIGTIFPLSFGCFDCREFRDRGFFSEGHNPHHGGHRTKSNFVSKRNGQGLVKPGAPKKVPFSLFQVLNNSNRRRP